jgi:hypothetical protein
MPLTKVSFSVIQVANNVTSTTVGNTSSIPSFTFDQNGVITSASNNAIVFPAGTASVPAITTTGDTNTGIFFPTADAVGFAVGGADAARLTNGTLSVSATSSMGSAIRLYEDTDNGTNHVDIVASAAITSNRTLTLPDLTGTLAVYADPQVTVYTSGSGTYTTPTGAKYLQVRMVGGGGGGGAPSGAGGNGGTSTFGTSFLTASPGAGGSVATGGPGTGGTATGGDVNLKGGEGGAGPQPVPSSYAPGGAGGNSPFGGGAGQSQATANGVAGSPNTGGGGSGGGGGVSAGSAGGGGAGGYLEKLITSPSSTYSYAVGAGGAAGSGGISAGGAGGSGVIIVTAYFG